LITTHQLPEEAFTALARGEGDPAVVRHLREAQRSKHLMLLHGIAAEAGDAGAGSPEIAAFQAAYELLVRVQEADRDTYAWVTGLPHIGAWAHECLERKDQGLPPDFAHLAAAAAAAAVRAGIQFELDVPVNDGRVPLPGLGYFHGLGAGPRVRLRGDAGRLAVGTLTEVPRAALVPDDGSCDPVQHWQGTHAARAVAGGRTWTVLLETGDRYLDRFALPMSALTAEEVAGWQECIQSAWELLVRHHGWAADSIAAGVSVIVPLAAHGDTELDSATTQAAFGAIATSLPPDPVIMAEILVHEFQHAKLCGLEDIAPLTEPSGERVNYAPWRPDPRPAGGLLQGVYAHLGIARFWGTQRHVATEPDDILRAQVMFERWRSMIEPVTATLLRTGRLTPPGARFVAIVRDQGQRLESEAVPAVVRAMAREAALDHRLTWQLRHTAIDAAAVSDLATAYQAGGPPSGRLLPEGRIEEDTRKVDSATRSRLLNMRFLEPRRYSELSDAGMPGLSAADRVLLSGQASMAVRAYRDEICAAPEPLPEAWTGLALAICLLGQTPLRPAFDTRLPLTFDVHACLTARGVRTDPLELAAWLG
jgi:HEXXH motif-containing protein